MGQLDGRTALVTGGTSGIGLATAERLVDEIGARLRRTEPAVAAAHEPRPRGSVLARPGMLVIILVFVAIGGIFGATDVATVAFAEEQGSKGSAGLILAVFALGSLIWCTWSMTCQASRRWSTATTSRLYSSASSRAPSSIRREKFADGGAASTSSGLRMGPFRRCPDRSRVSGPEPRISRFAIRARRGRSGPIHVPRRR